MPESPEWVTSALLPLLHVQFRQTEDSRRLDHSYRGWHRRAIPCLVDAADVRSLSQTPSPGSMSDMAMLRQLPSLSRGPMEAHHLSEPAA
jgi:hypothetical protein